MQTHDGSQWFNSPCMSGLKGGLEQQSLRSTRNALCRCTAESNGVCQASLSSARPAETYLTVSVWPVKIPAHLLSAQSRMVVSPPARQEACSRAWQCCQAQHCPLMPFQPLHALFSLPDADCAARQTSCRTSAAAIEVHSGRSASSCQLLIESCAGLSGCAACACQGETCCWSQQAIDCVELGMPHSASVSCMPALANGAMRCTML